MAYNKKFSILMPVYNNEKTIKEAIDSVLNQVYTNFEIILVDDGSTDSTEKIIKNYSDLRLKYFYQKNADQLNALLKCFDNSTGDYIYIFHGDDCLYDDYTLLNVNYGFESTNNIDAIIGNIYLMDEDSKIYSKLNRINTQNQSYLKVYLHLALGNNIINDFAFIRREAFAKFSYSNYLIWNMPFWANLINDEISNLRIENSEFPMLRYRYDIRKGGNYISYNDGKFNVLNGVIRTIVFNSTYVEVPFFNIQRFFFRILKDIYKPIFLNRPTKRISKLIAKTIKIYSLNVDESLFFKSIFNFFLNLERSHFYRKLEIDFIIHTEDVYFGKDIKRFNILLKEERHPKIYDFFFGEMISGFSEISTTISNKENLENILKFLTIYKHVKISYTDLTFKG